MHFTRRSIIGLLCASAAQSIPAQNAASTPTEEVIPSLRRLRAEAEDGATAIREKFSSSSTQYITARRKYGGARAAVEEVAGLLRQAILNGKEEDIRKSESLVRAAREAKEATRDLLESVDKSLGIPQKRSVAAVIEILGSIVTVAISLLKATDSTIDLGGKVDERRSKRASLLEAEIVWRQWDDLGPKK